MRLYINDEYCSSVEQLKGFFFEDLTLESEIYADLLDYGRHGDIAVWLRERNEPELSSKVEGIPTDLSDSAFFAQLKVAITGVVDTNPPKPAFDRCFSFEGIKCDVKDNEVGVCVSLKVLMCVNEEYELCVSSNWGTRGVTVNPYSLPEGKTACFDLILRKRPGKDIGDITVKAEGHVLSKSDKHIGENSDEIVVGNVKFKMIRVEGGTFMMGAPCEQEEPEDNEKPAHEVTLSSYSIEETPVTQELWQAVMGNNPSRFKGVQLPVECVSWNDCQKFIQKLNQVTGKEFRLPTEAEWEFAARGGMKSKGYEYSGSNDVDEVAWYDNNSFGETHPVKEKKPNELGIYDMSGNVWEWCQDWHGRYSSSSQSNPTGPRNGLFHISRGGSWINDAWGCRLSRRGYSFPFNANCDLGLRLALSK